MKSLKIKIQEGLKVSSKSKFGSNYNYFPNTKDGLKNLVKQLIKERGNEADLNDIDTSKITDMSYLFNCKGLTNFDGNISKWDVSNVTNMYLMFAVSKYSGKNGDISNWDVRNVENFDLMFTWAEYFDCNLNNWKVNKNASMESMFDNSPLEKNPPKWYKNK